MKKIIQSIIALSFFILALHSPVLAEPEEKIESKARCPVCGMFVKGYPEWIVQIRHQDDTVKYFDGVKDMFAYYFNTKKYSNKTQESISEIWVKDYYYLKWVLAKDAYFVVGSTVTGPMGHEFIPHSSQKMANAFKKDYKGEKIIPFDKVTENLVESIRAGSKMK